MSGIKIVAICVGLLAPVAISAAEQSRTLAEPKTTTVSSAFRVIFSDMLTPEDAKSISIRAAKLIKSKGKLAIAEFSRKETGFLRKDGYVFCMSMEGVMISHPLRNQLIGQNLYNYQRYGQPFFREMVKVAERDGEGWVDYRWPYPGTTELRIKRSYVIKNEAGFFCGVSAFK